MNLDELYPSKYIKGSDLKAKPHTLTIASLSKTEMTPKPGQPREMKWILYFKETEKGLILNRSNAEILFNLYGDTQKWTGSRITIFPMPVMVAGTERISIKMRAPAPATPAKPAPVQAPPGKTAPVEKPATEAQDHPPEDELDDTY